MRILVALSLILLAASCRCPRCWEKSEGYDFALAGTSTATIARTNLRECGSLRADEGDLDRSLWANTCNDHFQHYVMAGHCADSAKQFCQEKCPADSTCKPTGEQTLQRVCAESNFAEFIRLMPYCADFELENTVIVPKPDGAPRCE